MRKGLLSQCLLFHNAAPSRRFRETPPTATLKTKQYYCGVTTAAPAVSKTVCWIQSELQEGKKSLFSLSQVTKPLTLVSGLTPYQVGYCVSFTVFLCAESSRRLLEAVCF